MADEVELKAKIGSRGELAERIAAAGGSFLREVAQEDHYFAHPCRDLRGRDEALRLRNEGGSWSLTFKGRRQGSGVKIREELEAALSDGEAAAAILRRLGFVEALVIRKNRRIYHLDGAEVALDSVEGLGEFVEIELASEEGLTEEGKRERLLGLALRLRVSAEALTTASYAELLESKSSVSKASR